MTLEVSVCICTRNRPEELALALDSIAQSQPRPEQVVVSDDSDGPETKALVENHPLPTTYVRGPSSGLGANRNRAISVASSEYVLFLDDDATLSPDFLRKMELRLEQVPEVRRSTAILAGSEINLGRKIEPSDLGLLGFQSRAYKAATPYRTLVINAAVFPRSLFDRIRFDPQLMYGYDEVDLATQAVSLGFTIVPCFDIANVHSPSKLGREHYGTAATASRLYVTLKRRRYTEHSRLTAWGGFALATVHVYLASIRRLGVGAGLRESRLTVALACSYYREYRRSESSRGTPTR